jgi:hypothetical protein
MASFCAAIGAIPSLAEADTVIATIDANSAKPISKMRFISFFLPTAGWRCLAQFPDPRFVPAKEAPVFWVQWIVAFSDSCRLNLPAGRSMVAPGRVAIPGKEWQSVLL